MRKKLEKVLFIMLLILCSANLMYSQWSIGIQGGFNNSKNEANKRSENANISYKGGFVLGGLINYNLSSNFSIQTEPRYNQKGEAVQIKYVDPFTDSKIYFDYLEIPIYLIYEYPLNKFNPFLLGGFGFGYLVNAEAKVDYDFNETIYDISEDYSKTDFALELGAGVKYNVKSNINLLLNLRYSYGIIDISDFSDRDYDGDVKSRGMHLLMGVLYNL